MHTPQTQISYNLSFGQWVRRRRSVKDLTQEALAMQVGCAFETIRKVESGRRRPSRQLAALLAAALGATQEEIPALVDLARVGSDDGGEAVAGAAAGHDDHEATRAYRSPSPSSLPASRTSFIGRANEVERVRRFFVMEDARLVTLAGPPGIGKTRLALQVAALLSSHFNYGVLYVPFSLVAGQELVIPAMAQALGLKETAEQPLEKLLRDYLRTREMMLLLDNFEHVAGAAPFIGELLTECPFLRILVTSRTVLHLYGEQEFQVPALSLPSAEEVRLNEVRRSGQRPAHGHAGAAPQFEQYEAVQLFVQRALAVDTHFALTADNAPVIAQICLQLDGLPLAIELAAARCKLLPPEAILSRLDSKLKLLTTASMDLPRRQQTLRGAIDWSYDLLSDPEKTAFRRLAIFVGGATLDAIEAVCRLPSEPDPDILDVLTSLVDKSMLRIQAHADLESRFWMLLTLREYAVECLARSDEQQVIAGAHAAYYLALAEAAEPHLPGPRRELWLHRLNPELNNIRAALSWLLSDKGDPMMALRLAGALHWFWYFSGLLTEGRDWLQKATAAAPQGRTPAHARALNAAGRLAFIQDDYSGTLTMLEEAVAIWSEQESKRDLAYALVNLGAANLKRNRDDAGGYYALIERAVTLFQETGDRWGLAYALDFLADAALVLGGDEPQGVRYKEESLRLYRDLGDTWGVASQLSELGYLAVRQERYDAARSMLEEALPLMKIAGDRWYIAHTTRSLGDVVWHQGNYDSAAALYEESLILFREVGDRLGEANALRNLGHIALNRGEREEAEQLYGRGLALVRTLGNEQTLALFLSALAAVEASRGNMERAVRLLSVADNVRETSRGILPPPDYHQYNSTLTVLQEGLGEESFSLAREQARNLVVSDVLDQPYG